MDTFSPALRWRNLPICTFSYSPDLCIHPFHYLAVSVDYRFSHIIHGTFMASCYQRYGNTRGSVVCERRRPASVPDAMAGSARASATHSPPAPQAFDERATPSETPAAYSEQTAAAALEDALEQLGPFGMYQRYMLAMLCLPNILAAMYSLNYVFTADQVPFRWVYSLNIYFKLLDVLSVAFFN